MTEQLIDFSQEDISQSDRPLFSIHVMKMLSSWYGLVGARFL